MDVPEMIATSEGVLAIFMAGTWWWVLRQHDVYVGWRHMASLAGLGLATIALIIELVLAAELAYYGSLEASDAASLRGGWSAFEGWLWVCSFFAAGLLSFCGLVSATVGKGNPRIGAAVWSTLILGTFFANLILAVNSFH